MRKYIRIFVSSIFPIMLSSCNLVTNTPSTSSITVQPQMAAPSGQFLYGLFMLSANEGWAVGGTFDAQGVPMNGTILRYSGYKWTAIPSIVPLFSVFMNSSNDGWTVGFAGKALHYDGSEWKDMERLANSSLRSVFMLSAKDGWIVGDDGIILHYNGSTWAATQSQPLNGATLRSIFMISSNNGWIVGDFGKIFHYNGSQWTQVHSPTLNNLNSVFMVSAGLSKRGLGCRTGLLNTKLSK